MVKSIPGFVIVGATTVLLAAAAFTTPAGQIFRPFMAEETAPKATPTATPQYHANGCPRTRELMAQIVVGTQPSDWDHEGDYAGAHSWEMYFQYAPIAITVRTGEFRGFDGSHAVVLERSTGGNQGEVKLGTWVCLVTTLHGLSPEEYWDQVIHQPAKGPIDLQKGDGSWIRLYGYQRQQP